MNHPTINYRYDSNVRRRSSPGKGLVFTRKCVGRSMGIWICAYWLSRWEHALWHLAKCIITCSDQVLCTCCIFSQATISHYKQPKSTIQTIQTLQTPWAKPSSRSRPLPAFSWGRSGSGSCASASASALAFAFFGDDFGDFFGDFFGEDLGDFGIAGEFAWPKDAKRCSWPSWATSSFSASMDPFSGPVAILMSKNNIGKELRWAKTCWNYAKTC